MKQYIAHITLLVKDYDEAIKFYTEKLEFKLIEDTILSETKRWVLLSPKEATECCLLLARAANTEQSNGVGNQTGGRVFMFLYTDNFWRDHHRMLTQGIKFLRPPSEEDYGTSTCNQASRLRQ